MRILITNDDGIDAPGLALMHEIATEIAGETGTIWTAAPATEQSGTGHAVSFVSPMMLTRRGERQLSVLGTPADCVIAGLKEMGDKPPDLVLSGVNRGNNSGENALYSGTVGAALEASLQGVRAIALSQYYGPDNRDREDPFEAARTHGAAVVRTLLDSAPWEKRPFMLFYNVNFPPCPAADVAGTRAAMLGARAGMGFKAVPCKSPSGRSFMWMQSGPQNAASDPGCDVAANHDNLVSVTPMCADLTDHATLAGMTGMFR